jgi:hypothetical protein
MRAGAAAGFARATTPARADEVGPLISPVASSRAAKAAKNPRDYPACEVHEGAQCDRADNPNPQTREIVISPERVRIAVIDGERVGHSASVIKSSAGVDVPAALIEAGSRSSLIGRT